MINCEIEEKYLTILFLSFTPNTVGFKQVKGKTYLYYTPPFSKYINSQFGRISTCAHAGSSVFHILTLKSRDCHVTAGC